MDLAGFSLVEHARPDLRFDFVWREPADFSRRARDREQPARRREGHFIPGADGDDAANQHLKRRAEAFLGQLKQRRLGEGAHRLAKAGHRAIDVERLLLDLHCGLGRSLDAAPNGVRSNCALTHWLCCSFLTVPLPHWRPPHSPVRSSARWLLLSVPLPPAPRNGRG